MKSANVIVIIIKIMLLSLIFLTNFECFASATKNIGHLKCILGLNQQDHCGSSHFVEFLDVGENPNYGSPVRTAEVSSTSRDMAGENSKNFKIYVFDYFDDEFNNNDHLKFWNSQNFTWRLACHDGFRRIESYHTQMYGISINSLVMSGSMQNFFETFNMTSERTVADFCEKLKEIKCKFVVQPLPSEHNKNTTNWGGFAQSAFGFIINSFVYLGAARAFCR